MEWRQQTSVSRADAFIEAQRWIEEVTGKLFGCKDFRAALENGVLLCDLINQLKPGIIKRVNRLSTPIAGLDNVNVFLKACGKLGLNESQLFHPGDLQDLSTRATLRRDESNRRLKNVLITIYWLGRKAHLDAFYRGPQLSFKAFEGLLGLALSRALDEGSNVFVKDSWYPEREECLPMRRSYKVGKSVDSIDSMDSRALRPNSEGCGSDAEAEQVLKVETVQPSVRQIKGYLPPSLLQRNQGVEENGKGYASPLASHKALNSPEEEFDLDLISWIVTSATEQDVSLMPGEPQKAYQIQVRPEKVQVNPGWIWSKSLSDIPMAYAVRKIPDEKFRYCVGQDIDIAQEWNQENKHKCCIAAKNGEAQWQDDLTKWKNRRRSTKSDLYQKSQDREHVINKMINGAFNDFGRSEPGRLLKRDQQSHKHNPATNSPSMSLSKSSSSDLQPQARALLVRCFATETYFSPMAPNTCNNVAQTQGATTAAMPASDGNISAEESHIATLASDKGGVTTPSLEFPFGSQTQVKVQGSPAPSQPKSELARPENVFSKQISTLITTIQPNKTTKSTSTGDPSPSLSSHKELQFCTDPKVPTFFSPDTVNMAAVDTLEDHQSHLSLEENRRTSSEPVVDIGQQVSTVYKSSSGTGSWSSSASLPRGYRRSEGSLRLSSAITPRPFLTKQFRMSSMPRLCCVDDNQVFPSKREKAESFSPPIKSLLKRQTASVHLTGPSQPSIKQNPKQAKQNGTEQAEEGKDVTLTSQTSFQTNGHLQAQHNKTSPLPSSATTDHQKVDHSDMRVSFTLKPNSRPDFGFQTHWDSTGVRVKFIQPGSPAELCQLCVDDEIVAVNGVEVAHMSYAQWKDKMTSSLQTGSLTMDIRRYGKKDWSTSEGVHPNHQPGQSKMTLNLTTAAPALIGYPDHRANSGISADTAVRRRSKFNGQTDNVLQGKVMHGELAENHRTARSKGGSESAISDLQVPCLSPSSSSWSWNHEEDRRRQEKWQEEQERLLQEQYQRDQERLEAEWQRAQQDAMGELHMESGSAFQAMNGGESSASTQPHVYGSTNKTRGEEQSPDGDEQKDRSKPQSNGQAVQKDKMAGKARAENSCGFVQLSPAHRAKSLSTPALAGPHKQTRGDEGTTRRSLSKVEQERQQILEEMKKRTQLLTDNSWIRQRSSSLYKEPVFIGAPLKRFESLDNLESCRQSPLWSTTFSYPRPHSAAAGYSAPTRYSTGGVLSHRNGNIDPSHHGSVSAANDWSPSSNLKQEAIL